MSEENRANPPRMSIDEILAATGGPVQLPAKPNGPSEVTPLSPLGLDQQGAAPAPTTVTAQQGAGSGSGGLTPNAGQVADGSVHVGGNAPDSSGGPEQVPFQPGIAGLAPGPARPDGGQTWPGEQPGAAKDPRLSAGGGTGAGLNPALGRMPKTPPGFFGPPSV